MILGHFHLLKHLQRYEKLFLWFKQLNQPFYKTWTCVTKGTTEIIHRLNQFVQAQLKKFDTVVFSEMA